MEKQFDITIQQLINSIQNTELIGSSVTASLGEVEIDGVNYQIQIRLEKDTKFFIEPHEVVQGTVLDEINLEKDK